MTGPRTPTLHPLARRPWLLLPFLASVAFSSLGCSDQPTEPIATTKPVTAVVSHPVRKPAGSRIAASQSSAPKPLVSFSVAQAVAGEGPSVLILADTNVASTTALANSLAGAGFQVTVRTDPEYTWDGTNPSLSGFDIVVHLNGSSYEFSLPDAGQNALADFVANGGGFVGAKWNGYEYQPQLADLVLQGFGGDPAGPEETCGHCQITYEALPAAAGHPVLAGLPASFTFTADGHDAGPQIDFASNPSTVLMRVPTGGPAVLIREFGAGRIVNFSFAPNYYYDDLGNIQDPVMLQDPTIQQLYTNAVQWAGASASGTAQPQTITFDPLEDKVYGDPAFALGATSSSGLPVNYSASGTCEVLGVTVTIIGAGSCTITAHQAGNDSYEPAADVSRSFTIAKAPATITVGGEYIYDGTFKTASVTTSPSPLSGVTLTYTLNGVLVAQPVDAGVYQVVATLDNPNYVAEPTSGTLTIMQATPVLEWQPARISVGTPLSSAQLNAVAQGVDGGALSGSFVYTPPAGTRLKAGSHTLSVSFTPASQNYTRATKSVTIVVETGKSNKPQKKAVARQR
ncbi:MAG TPA: MBG domain-containing protein [Gemmatimonadales bacterium]|nr:MBG domain-containing protein [Gemmatimonadales bacterium]